MLCYGPREQQLFGKTCMHRGFQLYVSCCVLQTCCSALAVSVPMHHASGWVAPRAQHRTWFKGGFCLPVTLPTCSAPFPRVFVE